MKRTELKELVRKIIKELKRIEKGEISESMTTRAELDKGVMAAVNVEGSMGWDKPEEKSYSHIKQWVADNIKDGKYTGEPLHNYGFPYKVGDRVEIKNVGMLLLAMRNWNDAKKKRNDNLGLGRPVGFEEEISEMSTSGGAGAYSTPFAFSKKGSQGSPRAIKAAKKYGTVVKSISEETE